MLERRRPFLGVAGSLRAPRARRAHSPGAAAPRRRRPLLRGGCPRSPWAARGLREAAGRVSRVAVVGRGEGGGRLSVANRGQAPRPLPPGLRAAGRLPPASTMRHAILLVAAALAAAPGEKARHAAHAPQCRAPPPTLPSANAWRNNRPPGFNATTGLTDAELAWAPAPPLEFRDGAIVRADTGVAVRLQVCTWKRLSGGGQPQPPPKKRDRDRRGAHLPPLRASTGPASTTAWTFLRWGRGGGPV